MTYTFFLWIIKAILAFAFIVFFFECLILIIYFYRKIRKRDTRKILYRPVSIVIHLLALFWGYVGIRGYFVEPYWVQVNTISIYTEKLESTSFRIVQISDLHCVKKMRAEKRVVELVKHIKPDVIVFTGDALSHKDGLSLFQDTLYTMDAPLGKFAVTGNWDENNWSMLNIFANTGFKELTCDRAEVTKYGETIQIAGMGFYQDFEKCDVLKNLKPEQFTIFLYHQTDIVDYGDDLPMDLFLCGHTHGGQALIPFYGAVTTFSRHGTKYVAGLYDMGRFQMYVNRGIGMEGGPVPPIRFGARPEITVFDIQPLVK